MKSIYFLHLFVQLPTFVLAVTAPAGCRKLKTDDDWPTPEDWKARLPAVVPNNITDGGDINPDYRFQVQSACDVEAAMKFATDNNIRLTVITTGHDQEARSDAGSGLIIDLSQMRGVRVLESFTPTLYGAQSPDHNAPPNVIVPKEGVQAAVTFGPAVAGLALNYAVANSSLFTMTGASGMSFRINRCERLLIRMQPQ